MKQLSATYFCLLALSSLITVNASAGYVVPVVSSRPALAKHAPPPPPAATNTVIVTTTADSGPGSLRNAISNSAPGGIIRFLVKLPATINLSSSLIVDKDLTILGSGAKKLTVQRMEGTNVPSFRVFRVDADNDVTIAGLSIVNGRALNEFEFGDNLGGGIYSEGSLTVSNCVIAHNVAPTEADGNGFGGGIFASGALSIINTAINDNEASFAGGGVCTFHSESVRVERSAIYDNRAGIQGAGVNFQGLAGSFRNCTISGNETPAEGTASGLLHLTFENEGSALDVTACTFTKNFGNTNGAIVIAALPGNLGITTRFINTLVADNQAPNFFLDGDLVLQSFGHNLDSDGTSGWTNGVNGDQVGTLASPIDAHLASLADNGGPTETHALQFGSPAVDAGTCTDLDGAPLAVDQRSFARPQGLACDIGAFENQPPQVECPHAKFIKACDDSLTATVFDPDGDPLSMIWIVDGVAYQTNYTDGVHPPAPVEVSLQAHLAGGKHTITLRVSDGKAEPIECTTKVKAKHDKPPKIRDVEASPDVLSPANGQLVPVTITVQATDSCGSPVTSKIISVKSNEAVGSEPDWIITGDLTVSLRAENSNHGNGRTYTITVRAQDAAGNSDTANVKVSVPRKH